ncbi:hypothetical protein IWW35_000128 [Coemansia sp. RSA 1878]|nr:hypothetical protein IWW35_000128 [Coemansia sp. RSA 1878]
MGCCQSTTTAAGSTGARTDPTTQREAENYEPLPVSTIDFGHTTRWASEEAMTQTQLERKREQFWDTAPAFEGRLEVWQALRLACDSNDGQLAHAILASAGATVPTLRIVDGVYDDHGACYTIPQYCLSEPTNLISDCANGAAKTVDAQASMDSGLRTAVVGSPSVAAPSSPIPIYRYDSDSTSIMSASPLYPQGSSDMVHKPIKVRLSSGADVSARLTPDMTVAQLEQQLRDAGHLSAGRARFFFLGRLLSPELIPARDLHLTKHVILQVLMCS